MNEDYKVEHQEYHNRKNNNGDRVFKIVTIVALVVAVIGLSVAYASLSQQLKISGTAEVAAAKWDISNDGTPTTSTSGADASAEVNASTVSGVTTINIAAKLKKPTDYVEVTIPVKNKGDIDAVLATITGWDQKFSCTSDNIDTKQNDEQIICGDSSNTGANIRYTVTYNGTPITNGINSVLDKELASGSSIDIKVKVEYLTSETELPKGNVTVNLPEIVFAYQQDMN